MKRVVLLGRNIAHSRSPDLHNHLFQLYELPYRYELMPVEPLELGNTILALKNGDYLGANVTSPYKESILPLLDSLDTSAEAVNAVNTIRFEDGTARGFNTDGIGFRKSIEKEEVLTKPFSVAVLGTGGAARAAIHELLKFDNLVSITVYSRDKEKGSGLANSYSDARLCGESLVKFRVADIVVHATPVGLPGPTAGESLLTSKQLNGATLLYEMVYSSVVTPLMQEGRRAGARIINGRTMLIEQGLAAFTIWTGIVPKLFFKGF